MVFRHLCNISHWVLRFSNRGAFTIAEKKVKK